MAYTINKPNTMYDNTEEFKRRSRELRDDAKKEIERNRKHIEELQRNLAQYTCATINPNFYTCVSYNEPILPHTKSIDSKARNMYEEKIEELVERLKKISTENSFLKSQNALLLLKVKKDREEKAKKESISKFFSGFGNEFKSVYDKFIKWLNT